MPLRIWLYVLLSSCVLAENGDAQNRSTQRPFIADAVGNTIPPPSAGPAPVGSPSNLLTPDRYEFYTFDESGELVKRLMTLEEIQAIVAAGEGNEGHLVTLSNNDQPTIAFNFSQPPFTKVHSVVTNVQNVLKAQMEAQKNKPPTPTSFDTPDVSDSWSLILPSVFGNTGVDIVPDKSSSVITTPDTETIDIERPTITVVENSLSKEGSSQLLPNIETTLAPEVKISTTTQKYISPSTTKEITQTTTVKPRTTLTTISKPTTIPPKLNGTSKIGSLASKPTTVAPNLKFTTIAPKPTAINSQTTKIIQSLINNQNSQLNSTNLEKKVQTTKSNIIQTTEKINTIYFEKVNTITTPRTSTNKATFENNSKVKLEKPTQTTPNNKFESTTTEKNTKVQPPVTTYKPVQFTNSHIEESNKNNNTTTLTTQSVSPSTTISSTQYMKVENIGNTNQFIDDVSNNRLTDDKNNLSSVPDIPLFDVAQSISQIASDLGNNFPNPTTSTTLETTKLTSTLEAESKENVEIEIPSESKEEPSTESHGPLDTKLDNDQETFIKVSTIHPTSQILDVDLKQDNKINNTSLVITTSTNTPSVVGTTIDPILSESMDDLLSQVVNQVPQSILSPSVNESKGVEEVTSKLTYASSIITTSKVETISSTEATIPQINNRISVNDNNSNGQKISSPNNTVHNFNLVNDKQANSTLHQTIEDPINNSTEVVKETGNVISNTVQNLTKVENTANNEDKKTEIKDINPLNNYTYSNYNIETNSLVSKQDFANSKPALNNTKSKNEGNTINAATNPKFTIHHKINTPTDVTPKDDIKKKIQKINIDDKEFIPNNRNNSWKLISTVSPPKSNEIPKDKIKTESHIFFDNNDHHKEIILDGSKENQGLEATTKDLAEDIYQFTELCNELAFRYWNTVIENIDKRRTFVLSPYSITSMLAMMFMGARGATSGEMNDILKLDDMVTFNPHFTLKNISDSIETSSSTGVAVSAFIRELYSDKERGKILTFYKERAQHFYNGHVEEVNFKAVNDIIRRRTNLLVKRFTWGKIGEYMKSNSITVQPPLAAVSINIFETDCSGSSVDGRDGEMYFVVSPNVRQRRLVPVPAVVYKEGFLAGYDPVLDATAAALGTTNNVVSTLFLMPGQQGNIVHGEDLDQLERRFLSSHVTTPTWNRLLRTLLPRIGLEVQIPRFAHKSTFNVSSTLRQMGLKDLFNPETADLGGINGPTKDLYLSDMVQTTMFATCGENVIGEQHHVEEYPESPNAPRRRRTSRWASGWDEPRDYQRAFHDPHDVGEAMHLPLHLRPRQARLPARSAQPARLKFDRPFLYFVRHNPSGMILYVGRYNPRLLP